MRARLAADRFSRAIKEGDSETRLWLFDLKAAKPRQFGAFEVVDTENLIWDAAGESIMLVRAWPGRHEVARLTLRGEKLTTLVGGDRQFGGFASCASHTMYSVHTPVQPDELFACAPDGSGECQISKLKGWSVERTPLPMQARKFEVPNGRDGNEPMEGWLLRAKGNTGPSPLLNDIHGGPVSYAQLDYDTNVFWQALCSNGWAVLMLNQVGSSSFGGDFCKRLSGR